MHKRCPSGKRLYPSQQLAEDALIELWAKNDYQSSNAPLAVYRCDDCGEYHLTSRGPMNLTLAEQIQTGKIKLQREANTWIEKIKKKKF